MGRSCKNCRNRLTRYEKEERFLIEKAIENTRRKIVVIVCRGCWMAAKKKELLSITKSLTDLP